jgi:hypothetical protein
VELCGVIKPVCDKCTNIWRTRVQSILRYCCDESDGHIWKALPATTPLYGVWRDQNDTDCILEFTSTYPATWNYR